MVLYIRTEQNNRKENHYVTDNTLSSRTTVLRTTKLARFECDTALWRIVFLRFVY